MDDNFYRPDDNLNWETIPPEKGITVLRGEDKDRMMKSTAKDWFKLDNCTSCGKKFSIGDYVTVRYYNSPPDKLCDDCAYKMLPIDSTIGR